MNGRKRFRESLLYGKPDHLFDTEFGYWDETRERWFDEGLPRTVVDHEAGHAHFGFEEWGEAPIHLGMHPEFERKVLEDLGGNKVLVQDTSGIRYIEFKEGIQSIPQYHSFPVTDRDSFIQMQERYDSADPWRLPSHYEAWVESVKDRTEPLSIFSGSLYGWLRDWMGVENLSITFARDPDLICDMMDFLVDHFISVISKPLRDVRFDCSKWWEDMCYKHGPLISPAMFKEFMVPRYKRITSLLEENGVDIHILDCDGDVTLLIPGWLESGINVSYPLEVAGGSDPVVLREQYGKDLLLMGGVDKIPLIKGKDAIDAELERLKPLVEEGGFIPHVDHRVPPDVSLENYRHYVRRKREVFEIPDPLAGKY